MRRRTSFLRPAPVTRLALVVVAVVVVFNASHAMAEVEVTLKSGASLVGNVTVDGADAVVKIDNSELRVPLAEIDSITSVDAGPERQARRAGQVPHSALANSTPSGVSANHSSASFSRQGIPSPVVTDASCRSRSWVSCIGLSPPWSAGPVGLVVVSVRRVRHGVLGERSVSIRCVVVVMWGASRVVWV